MSRLKFFSRQHRYKLDGQWVPGVTTILKGIPKDALMYWSARTVAEWVADNRGDVERLWPQGRGPMVAFLKELPWQKRDDAADRGTIVHAITARVIDGETLDVDPLHAGHVEAAMVFLADYGVEVLHSEVPGFHDEHRYAGTVDVFGRITRGRFAGKVAAIDWKTADSGVWPETALQLAGYRGFTHLSVDGQDIPTPATDLGIGVHLTPDGYEAFDLPSGPDEYRKFRHVRVVADLVKSFKDDKDGWVRTLQNDITEESA